MPPDPRNGPRRLATAARRLRREVDALAFGAPVSHVYNPLAYAWRGHQAYLDAYAGGRKRVVFLGMNPGPFGMAQTGVPFGDVGMVRDWLGISAKIDLPADTHPKRPVQGFDCPRSEVSGTRLWGAIGDHFGSPRRFFAGHFLTNYCPLVFVEASGRNRTPDKLPAAERQALYAAWRLRRGPRPRGARRRGAHRPGPAPEPGQSARPEGLGRQRPARARAARSVQPEAGEAEEEAMSQRCRPIVRTATVLVLLACAPAGRADPDWQAKGRAAVARAREGTPALPKARNVVLFVGDGMGVSTVTAARILEGQLRGEPGEENLLAFERLPYTALAKTYNTNQQVPDSAGTMTAMVTGSKTRAGVLSVDATVPLGDHRKAEGHHLETLFEQAETRSLATGVVTTANVTHATPAACYAHSPYRGWESDADLSDAARADGFPDIARQLLEFPVGDGLEVALGGGRAHFLPATRQDPEHAQKTGRRLDGRDLMAEWSARPRSAAVWSAPQLAALDLAGVDRLLGLFEPSHMQWEAHRPGDPAGEPSLAEMTETALTLLRRDEQGFVLMVEGGRIDHGHHAGSAYLALHDTIAFSQAVERALALVDRDETLVVVTADHSHVLTIAGYPTRGNPILGLVVHNDRRGEPRDEPRRDSLGLPYTTLAYANGPGYAGASDQQPEGPKHFPHRTDQVKPATRGRPDLSEVDTTSPAYLQESAVPFSSETHGGEDVVIYAGGPGAALFRGVQEQSYVYHAIVAALGWDPATSDEATGE
jgi:alkaline phosphatase